VIGFSGIGALGILALQIAKAMVRSLIHSFALSDLQGLKVVGVDVRDKPLQLADSLKLKPDLLLNASEVSAEEGAKMVEKLRPDGWDHGPGCDGMSHLHSRLTSVAIVNLNTSEAGLKYVRTLIRNHGTLVMTAGPMNVTFSMLDFIFKQINVFGTQNGSGQDLRETVELCSKFGIQSSLKLYRLEEDSLRDMVADTEAAEWSGKAVVII
jgi:D-arabinose 1-dehydrogenase-like Zn-dependent alcohol dehydrogenase